MVFDELICHSYDVFDADIVEALATRYRVNWRDLTATDVAQFVYLAALTPTLESLDGLQTDLHHKAQALPTEHGDPMSEDVVQALTYLLSDHTRPLRAINSIEFDSSDRTAVFEMRNGQRTTYASTTLPAKRHASRPLRVYAPWFFSVATRIAGKNKYHD